MTFVLPRIFNRTAVTLSLALTSACAAPASRPEAAPEEQTTADDRGSSNQPDLGLQNTIGLLEVAYIGAQQPVHFETQELVQPESVAGIEPQRSDWLTATAVDSSGEVILTEVVSASCAPQSFGQGRTRLVPTDVATIQGAIDVSAPGDTVAVAPGTYYEHLQLADGVRLVGSGAGTTILDGNGETRNLIEVIGGHNTLVQGFTLRGVEQAEGCASSDPTACSGNWYASALYVAPFDDGTVTCGPPSIIVVQNVFEANDIGMMAYFQPYVVLRNNVFQNNRVGFVANHHGSGTGLISHNVFFNNHEQAVALSASYIDVINNIFANNGVALEHQYVQKGRVSCNVYSANAALGGVELGVDGNVELDPLFASPQTGNFSLLAASGAKDAGCSVTLGSEAVDAGASAVDAGARAGDAGPPRTQSIEAGIYGGIFGDWSGAAIR